eukprot:GHVO01030011.1.p2 GENE.GHVO01030011.1~~GHVO01030011.1.p2  ORF type:complete len:195 (-),score=20.53 GHVO01030011.1:1274-1858(-)
MSNELSLAAELRFNKAGKVSAMSSSGRLTISGNVIAELEQTVYTVEELLNLGQLGSLAGYVLIENLDSTNFVELRPASGGQDMIKIRAGMCALFELADNVTTTAFTGFTSPVTPTDTNTIPITTTAGIVEGDTIEITTASRRDFYTVSAVSTDASIDVVGPALSEAITTIEIVDGPYIIADTAACRVRLLAIEI